VSPSCWYSGGLLPVEKQSTARCSRILGQGQQTEERRRVKPEKNVSGICSTTLIRDAKEDTYL